MPSIHTSVYASILKSVLTYAFTYSFASPMWGSKVHPISFKHSWAPFWQGCGTITDTISSSLYFVVEKKNITHHPYPCFFLSSSPFVCVCVCHSVTSLSPLLPSLSSLSSCHLPSPPTEQSAVHSSTEITQRAWTVRHLIYQLIL